MKRAENKSRRNDFTITDHVLLLFNEHDTRIALNWQIHSDDGAASDCIADKGRWLPVVI
jgi:hypothetical protein